MNEESSTLCAVGTESELCELESREEPKELLELGLPGKKRKNTFNCRHTKREIIFTSMARAERQKVRVPISFRKQVMERLVNDVESEFYFA